jgi:hypothetical protein
MPAVLALMAACAFVAWHKKQLRQQMDAHNKDVAGGNSSVAGASRRGTPGHSDTAAAAGGGRG